MSFPFIPTIIVDKLTDLTPQQLLDRGITFLMLDFDNTIVPYTSNEPTEEMEQWLSMMQNSPVQLCVVSNSKRDRVKVFCQKYGIACITHSKKPFPKGIRQCLKQFGIAPKEAALVGDQIFTDTLGANGCGVMSLLVKAIDNHNFWLKARHVLELPFIFFARNRRITK